jgi:predicted Zn-ribbon and HTH transcriptional regulator
MKEIIPKAYHETVRQAIINQLQGRQLTAGALSKEIGRPEKEIYDHLEQIKRTVSLVTIPAECNACGYQFKDREKARKPSKCPKCKGTYINQPSFSIKSG